MNNLTELNYEMNKMLTVPIFLGQYLSMELSASSRV